MSRSCFAPCFAVAALGFGISGSCNAQDNCFDVCMAVVFTTYFFFSRITMMLTSIDDGCNQRSRIRGCTFSALDRHAAQQGG